MQLYLHYHVGYSSRGSCLWLRGWLTGWLSIKWPAYILSDWYENFCFNSWNECVLVSCVVIRNKRIHYNIVFAKGGADLPIAHAFRLPEPTQNTNLRVGVPPLRPGPLAALRFGSICMERRKKNNAKFSGHYVRPHTHNVRAHAIIRTNLIQRNQRANDEQES